MDEDNQPVKETEQDKQEPVQNNTTQPDQETTPTTAKLVMDNGKELIGCLKAVNGLVNEVVLHMTPEGVNVVAMDPSNVAMVIMNLNKAMFVEYNVDKNVDAFVNLAELMKVLKRYKEKNMLTLKVEDAKLYVLIQGATVKKFELPLLDYEPGDMQKIPELNFAVSVVSTVDKLNEAILDAKIVAEGITFKVDKSQFSVLGSANNQSNADIELNDAHVSGDDCQAKYSGEYLEQAITKNVDENVVISFGDEYPLQVKYKNDNVELRFIIAPRVDSN